jgi:DNA replication protein DnaC
MSESKSAASLIGVGPFAKAIAEWSSMTPEQKAERDRKFGAEKKQREQEQHYLEVAKLRQAWSAPKRHTESAITPTGEWGERLAAINKRIGKGMLVALIGIRGTGKTQMAVEVMRAATEALRSTKYITAMEFFMSIKATYRDGSGKSEQQVIDEYRAKKLLVIDEIGKRGQTDWENNLLFELINRRYNDMSDTLVIDNSAPAEFVAAIGPSIASRMNECGGIIECKWESFRK